MKLVTVVGARPQFIKAAALSRVIEKDPCVEELIINTGQHFDASMSKVFFDQLGIRPAAYDLGIHSLSHGAMTGRMLEAVESVLLSEKPDCLLVYGDTNSTIAGALAAKKLHIPVAHVEAGLRSFNSKMPEEVNRVLTDHLSDWLFCPTEASVKNLEKEGITGKERVRLVGDVMYDVSRYYSRKSSVPLIEGQYVLCTLHRAENTESPQRLKAIVSALNQLSKCYKIVLPLHPRTRKKMDSTGLQFEFETLAPADYMQMINYLSYCEFVLTDSGGVQKEAYFFSKPCLTMRDETEWVELLDEGVNQLVGADEKRICQAALSVKSGDYDFSSRLYGSGDAASKILESLLK